LTKDICSSIISVYSDFSDYSNTSSDFYKEGKMAKEGVKEKCCATPELQAGCCKVEAMVSIDERGQMVLPKELRDKAGIRPGDKLAVVSMQKDGKTCCLSLIKAETLTDMVKDMLGPLMGEIFQK
jgi:AbrB family looped-hinge helix DNA binding protein